MVISAIESGCDAIGFSAHTFTPFDSYYCMPVEKIGEYRKAVREIGEKYKDKIKVFLGIEQDVESDARLYSDEYDYKIGSVHSVKKNGDHSVDESPERLWRIINEHFDGDPYALAEAYFETLSRVYEVTHCDIVGHIDLITKFNENGEFFDEKNERYVAAAEKAIKKLVRDGVIFEINTGAMSRGYRKTPYPAKRLLEIVRREGGSVTYSSDCHAAEYILCGYEESVKLAKECGFDGFMKLMDGKWELSAFDN
jgi:histidinol-phosphatase (PHP family)